MTLSLYAMKCLSEFLHHMILYLKLESFAKNIGKIAQVMKKL